MVASKIGNALANLQEEVNTLEKVLAELIGEKNMVSAQSSNKQLAVSETNMQLQQTPIAIIGMAAIFPKARDLQEYWENIIHEVDCITDVPSTHWDVEAYYDPDPRAPDKTYCKRGGFVPNIDFNPIEFGLPPNLLEVTDISQLLSLVVAKNTLEDAGYGQSNALDREHTGVILGAVGRQLSAPLSARLQYPIWERVLKNSGLSDEDTKKIVEKIKLAYVRWEENSFPGMLSNVISGRIANRFDFGGTNCTIDAACASSLAAFKMAISELVEGRCNMMLTGGIDTDNSAFTYLCFSKTPALSQKQQTRPFDADSDGMMLGEGLGMVMLKRLEDAERDQNKIYAVIRGIGTSSDGRYKSIYAPRPEGQVKALRRAYQAANISPTSVGLIEAHGTGTAAGDPAEFAALNDVFSHNNPQKQYIALGSVKSQIGHTKTAAGVASVIKAALALHHKILPATINVTNPNPKLVIDNSPFYLNTKTRPWFQTAIAEPRRAGVSSFGFGGTNFHVVLEEYQQEHERPYRLHRSPQAVLLVAETPKQLLAECEAVLQQLQIATSDRSYIELIDRCKSPNIPITSARVGFVVESQSETCSKLQTTIKLLKAQSDSAWDHPQGIYYRPSGMTLDGKVVALFSGQGSQYLEMGRELVMNFPTLRQSYDQMDKLLIADGLHPISTIVFPPPVFESVHQEAQAQMLQRTEYAQPAIAAFSVGLYKIMQQAGFKPNFVAGHSFGEFTALWAAGALSDKEYFSLVKARGQAMAPSADRGGDTGTMIAVKGDVSQIRNLIKPFHQIAIANYNSDKQVVLAGSKLEIAKVQQSLSESGYSVVPLPVAGAFHTPLVGYAQKPFAAALEQIKFNRPQIPVYANVTGDRHPSDCQAIQTLLKQHLINPVLFKQEIENIYAAGGSCFVEFGPRAVLTHLVKEILGDRPHLAIALNASRQKDSDRQLREAAVQLQVAGLALTCVDPYELEQQSVEAQPDQKLSFRLNGASYVSDKTKMEFEKALQDGHRVKLVTAQLEQSMQNMRNDHDGQDGHGNHHSYANGHNSRNGHNGHYNESLGKQNGRGKSTMPQPDKLFHQQPAQSLTPQSQVSPLNSSPVEQVTIPVNAVSQNGQSVTPTVMQPDTVLSPEPVPAIATTSVASTREPIPTPAMPEPSLSYQRALDSLEYALTQFNQHQGETLQVHKQYLNHQMEYAKIFFQLMQQQNELLLNNPNVNSSTEAKTAVLGSLERNMMRFHDHQAGTLRTHEQSLSHQLEYSKNFFQLVQHQCELLRNSSSTPRHAELTQIVDVVGVTDTSSRQELVEEKLEKPPVLEPVLEPLFIEETLPKRDLESKLEPLSASNNGANSQIEKPEMQAEISAVVTPVPITSAPSLDQAALSQALIAIVSDKTGYPDEMLEMDMDMEADLGIDSIKRVEILGAFMEKFPELPQPNIEEMAEAELRTLGQIVGYMRSLAAEISSNQVGVEQSNGNASTSNLVEFVEVIPVTADSSDLSALILNVISGKTGYPVDALNLDMDLEADLGIDPVKRVEIFGALADKVPVLLQPESIAIKALELQTLKQMVEYVQSLVQGVEKKTISTNRLMATSTI